MGEASEALKKLKQGDYIHVTNKQINNLHTYINKFSVYVETTQMSDIC